MAVRRGNISRATKRGGYRMRRRMRRGRKGALARVPRKTFQSDVHYFKRMAGSTTIVGNIVNAPYLAVQTYDLNQVINPAEFTVLFDHYMITTVVTKMWLRIDPSAQAAASASYPKLYWARDTDDSTIPANLNELRQYSTCKVRVFHPNRPITIVTRPNLLALSYSSATTSNYTPVWNKWIDCGDTTTRHYGFKFGIDDLTNTNYRVDIEHIYYLKFKGGR